VFSEVSLLVIDYKHLVIDYMIKNLNSKPFLKVVFHNCRLVIDYQAGLDLPKAMLCLLKQPCINLETMFVL